MTLTAVWAWPYLGTVSDWELIYVHTLARSVHTYTSPIRVHARMGQIVIYVATLAHVWLYPVLPTYLCTCMLGYDCYEYVIDQVLDASLWWQSLPHLILYSTCLSSCIFIRERGSWSLLASFISSLYYNYLGSLVNLIQKWFEPKSRQAAM
jgi:hypothetical protein